MNNNINTNVNISENLLKNLFDEHLPVFLSISIKVILALIVFWLGTKIIKKIINTAKAYLVKHGEEKGATQFIGSIINVFMYLALVILVAFIFGITTTAIATLIGSLAISIGMGFQGTLSNFVGGIIIVVFKPFDVGDYIVAEGSEYEGYVTEIQVFYTKLRTLSNEIIIVPNGKLTANTVINNTAYDIKRLEVIVPIQYSADIDYVKGCLYNMLDDLEFVLQEEPKQVYINDFSDSSIKLGVRFYVESDRYYNILVVIRDHIKDTFDKNNIVIPFNQLDITIKQEN